MPCWGGTVRVLVPRWEGAETGALAPSVVGSSDWGQLQSALLHAAASRGLALGSGGCTDPFSS